MRPQSQPICHPAALGSPSLCILSCCARLHDSFRKFAARNQTGRWQLRLGLSESLVYPTPFWELAVSFSQARSDIASALLFAIPIALGAAFLHTPADASTCVAVPQPPCVPHTALSQAGSISENLTSLDHDGLTSPLGWHDGATSGDAFGIHGRSLEPSFGGWNVAQLGAAAGMTIGAETRLGDILSKGRDPLDIKQGAPPASDAGGLPTTPLPSTIFLFGTVLIAGASMFVWRNRSNAVTQAATARASRPN